MPYPCSSGPKGLCQCTREAQTNRGGVWVDASAGGGTSQPAGSTTVHRHLADAGIVRAGVTARIRRSIRADIARPAVMGCDGPPCHPVDQSPNRSIQINLSGMGYSPSGASASGTTV